MSAVMRLIFCDSVFPSVDNSVKIHVLIWAAFYLSTISSIFSMLCISLQTLLRLSAEAKERYVACSVPLLCWNALVMQNFDGTETANA